MSRSHHGGEVWLGEFRTREGDITFRVGRAGGELVAEWPGLGRLYAAPDGSSHRWEIVSGADEDLLDKIQHGVGRALIWHLQGGLSLHAASAGLNGKAVVCIGESGAGKSSLIADFCQRFHAELLADDVAGIDEQGGAFVVLPGEHAHWVGPRTARVLGHEVDDPSDDKYWVEPPAIGKAPVLLVACVSLTFHETDDPPTLRSVAGLDALELLLPSLARFALDDREAQLREYERLESLAKRVPLLVMSRPRSLHRLEQSSALLRTLFEKQP